ncbi:hypothetical protein BLNAU_5919 [Blattamonas nauphoetae]|uniref:Uncharacterized protein n=1 Tax=Blattamonas nauphoetae TaxID=2049346 RepID=A0ABQ9Y616_9EUKA|nr:hypothetical protein BLNAU_5919 [Blattamonas nauphoetae]
MWNIVAQTRCSFYALEVRGRPTLALDSLHINEDDPDWTHRYNTVFMEVHSSTVHSVTVCSPRGFNLSTGTDGTLDIDHLNITGSTSRVTLFSTNLTIRGSVVNKVSCYDVKRTDKGPNLEDRGQGSCPPRKVSFAWAAVGPTARRPTDYFSGGSTPFLRAVFHGRIGVVFPHSSSPLHPPSLESSLYPPSAGDLVLLLTLRIPLFLSMFFPSAVHRVLLSNLQTHHYNILLRLSEHGIPRTLRSALLQLRHVRRAV